MPAQIIDGKTLAETVRNQVAVETRQLIHDTGIVPHLAAVLVGSDPASEVYVRNKERVPEGGTQEYIASTRCRNDAG